MKIVNYIGGSGSWGDLTPETMNKKGLGGRETALVQLSENWAKSGHEVINFVPVNKAFSSDNGVRFVPSKESGTYLKSFPVDVLVSWEEARIFGIPEIRDNVRLGIIEMQVSNLATDEDLDAVVDYYAVLSEWAGEHLMGANEFIDTGKVIVFPNGVDINRFSKPKYGKKRNSAYKFFYSSSPDRGLEHLLNMWPKIREEFPDSELFVAYGVEAWIESNKWGHNIQSNSAMNVQVGLNQPGVNYLGKIGQDELAKVQEACDLLLYPADTVAPTETGCITIVEAGAACTPVITTDCDCIGPEFAGSTMQVSLPIHYNKYIDAMRFVLSNNKAYVEYQQYNRKLAEQRNWELISNDWLAFFNVELSKTYAVSG